MSVGDKIMSAESGLDIKTGNAMRLKAIPGGTLGSQIEPKMGQGGEHLAKKVARKVFAPNFGGEEGEKGPFKNPPRGEREKGPPGGGVGPLWDPWGRKKGPKGVF